MDTYKIAVSKMKLAEKLLPGDPLWPKFNASFENVELETGDLLNAIWYGRAITTHHSNNWRASKNYLMGQHIGLDFDNEDEHSTLDYLYKDSFIRKYGAFIHTTMSHTEETPRARVMFLLDNPIHQPKNYTMAASALLWLFGTADRQCKDAVRFFYGSPGCEFEYINNVLPIAVVKELISKYKASGATEKRRRNRPDYLPPANQEEVADALKHIDPWQVNYDEWVSILMAIHSQFGEGGFALADSWAEGKPGEVAQKWRSFHQNGNTQGQITIATLFAIAKEHGWTGVREAV